MTSNQMIGVTDASNQAIAGINTKTKICETVALASDNVARREMDEQGLMIEEVTTSQARQMLGEKVDLPYAVAE